MTDTVAGNDCATTPLYWDCECSKRYIHSKEYPTCGRCNTTADTQPDSRVAEVAKRLHLPTVRERDDAEGKTEEALKLAAVGYTILEAQGLDPDQMRFDALVKAAKETPYP